VNFYFEQEKKMKQFFWVILLMSGIVTVYAQQSSMDTSDLQTSAQAKQNAREYLDHAKSNLSQIESNQKILNEANIGNKDMATYNRLKNEIEKLEASINTEQTRIRTTLKSNGKVSPDVFERVNRLIEKHKAKIEEIEAFAAG
jgi:uncharacterized protein (UPF0333 family)